jgi:dihydrolipoamide dehydrogenase
MEREVDVVVVGAGPVGENVADRVRAGGLDVVLVEHELVGGECSYWACVPSKTLLRSAAALRAARRVAGAAEAITGELDVAAVLRRRDHWVSDWNDHGAAEWVASVGIELERGHGRLAGPRRVVVEHADGSEVTLVARHAVVVSTGSDPVPPPIVGLAEASPWTSRDANERPGARPSGSRSFSEGGFVAVRDGDGLRRLRHRGHRAGPHDVLGDMEEFDGRRGGRGPARPWATTVRLGVEPMQVERNGSGECAPRSDDDSTVTADEVLVAPAHPRSRSVGLETVGLEPGTLARRRRDDARSRRRRATATGCTRWAT